MKGRRKVASGPQTLLHGDTNGHELGCRVELKQRPRRLIMACLPMMSVGQTRQCHELERMWQEAGVSQFEGRHVAAGTEL